MRAGFTDVNSHGLQRVHFCGVLTWSSSRWVAILSLEARVAVGTFEKRKV